MDWVIDTDVLVRANDNVEDHDHWTNVFRLLDAMDRGGDSIVVDYNHEINRQYRDNLTAQGWVIKFINKFARTGQTKFVSGYLTRRLTARIRAIGFHDDDEVFIGAASNSSGALLAEESDYTPEVISILSEHGVVVMDCARAGIENAKSHQ